jgi:microcystin-dependent protein
VIGTIYGGDGKTNFALPKLVGATPVGISSASGKPPIELGEPVAGAIPGLGLAWMICIEGRVYPSPDGNAAFPSNEAFIGQVIAYAGPNLPPGWALCDGALLPIRDFTPLFSLIGNTYGGDGQTTFALPNLSGLMIQGMHG